MGNSAIVTRCWRLPAPSAAIVELRHEHGHVMSEYQLLCQGEVVHTVKATTLDILELAFTLSYIKCGGSGVREEHEGMVQVHPQILAGASETAVTAMKTPFRHRLVQLQARVPQILMGTGPMTMIPVERNRKRT